MSCTPSEVTLYTCTDVHSANQESYRGGGGVTPYNGLYGEAPPERGTFFRPQVYEREGILLFGVYERVEKSIICVCERA